MIPDTARVCVGIYVEVMVSVSTILKYNFNTTNYKMKIN